MDAAKISTFPSMVVVSTFFPRFLHLAIHTLAVLGEISISGTMMKVENLADTLQVCLDSGAKKVLLPQTSFVDFATVPPELMSAFQLIPYQSAEDAVFKALGVE